MRIVGRIVLALVSLIAVAALAVMGTASYRLSRKVSVPAETLAVPSDSDAIARGEYLATAVGKCVECHGSNLGGRMAFDAGPVGKAYGSNLTKGTGGLGAALSDADLERAIRHGVAPDGRKLVAMPAEVLQFMSDDDLGALIAYIRSVPPVDGAQPPTRLGPLGRALYVFGQLPAMIPAGMVDHAAPHAPHPPAGPTAEYGLYLANIGGCRGCHGPGLSGGQVPGTPPEFKPASNLTPEGIGHYTEADFFRALREGLRPDKSPIDTFMPWRLAGRMTDDDIRAVYAYLKTVPPKAFGGR